MRIKQVLTFPQQNLVFSQQNFPCNLYILMSMEQNTQWLVISLSKFSPDMNYQCYLWLFQSANNKHITWPTCHNWAGMGALAASIHFIVALFWPILAYLTYWGRNKMAAISQTMFSNEFSWMKMFEFRLRFHWNLFPRVQLAISQHRFR